MCVDVIAMSVSSFDEIWYLVLGRDGSTLMLAVIVECVDARRMSA